MIENRRFTTVHKIICLIFTFSLLTPFVADSLAAEKPISPPFTLTSMQGKPFTERDLLGKTTLIVFWASWCGTCQHELPKIQRLQEKLADRPFQVLAIGFRDSEENINHYVKSHPDVFSFPVFYDKGDEVSARFGAMATPTLFLFDEEGRLVVPYRGGGLLEHPKFNGILEALLVNGGE